MAVKQYALGAVTKNKLNVVTSNPASDGSSAVRVIIDDTYATSEVDVLMAIDACVQRIREDNWPVT